MAKELKLAVLFAVATVAWSGAAAAGPRTHCVDFEPPLALGTKYGAPVGQTAGSVVFTANGIPVAVDDFHFVGGGGSFNVASIDHAPMPVGSGQSLRTNNIDLLFDFSQLGFLPSEVRFAFLDLGGSEDVSVNGCIPYKGELAKAPAAMCGAKLSVATTPVTGGVAGQATLRGFIVTLKVGGQEFWLDDVCAQE